MKEEELKVNTFLILEGYQSGTKRFYGGTSLHTLIFSEIVYLPADTFKGGTTVKKNTLYNRASSLFTIFHHFFIVFHNFSPFFISCHRFSPFFTVFHSFS